MEETAALGTAGATLVKCLESRGDERCEILSVSIQTVLKTVFDARFHTLLRNLKVFVFQPAKNSFGERLSVAASLVIVVGRLWQRNS